MVRKRSEHYVNNKEFLAAIVAYKLEILEAEKLGKPKPRITNYLGECFLKIATHLSYKPNFVNYMFREDMISDGIENCVQYIHNFDPEKSKNPFAYFTQIIHYAFLRRIQKEKKQLEIKTKIIEKTGFDEVMAVDDNSFNGLNLIKEIADIYEKQSRLYNFVDTEILSASIRSVGSVSKSFEYGAGIVTMPPSVFEKMYNHILTDKGLDLFQKDWDAANVLKYR